MFLKKNARGNSLTKLLKNTDLQEIMSQLNQKSITIFLKLFRKMLETEIVAYTCSSLAPCSSFCCCKTPVR